MKLSIFYGFRVLGLCSLCAVFSSAHALEIADVQLEEQVQLPGSAQALVLNGAGIRYKFFFKVYVGALYLTEQQQSAEKILAEDAYNRVVMHIVYDEVPKTKLVSAWQEGFTDNNSEETMASIKDRLHAFNDMFIDLKQGDIVLLDYLPGSGTRVKIKGKDIGVIAGADFNRALLSVWLGDEPVTLELKEALLGVGD